MPQRLNYESDDADRFLEAHTESKRSEVERTDEQRLLETVLEETLNATSMSDAVNLVRSVALRSATSDITDIKVMEELVREILLRRLKNWSIPSTLPRQVAEILLDDPQARIRLVRLWTEAKQA